MTLYGYYSVTQVNNNKKSYVYLDENNKEVHVSEVTSIKKEVDEINIYFKDNIYMGIVTTYLRSHKY